MNEKMSDVVLQAHRLGKRFHDGDLDVTVLHNLDLQVSRAQTLAIVGASGAGKSTLLHLLGGLDTPTTGSVSLMGRTWTSMNAAEQGVWRNRHLGFVYQFHHLLPEFTALDNVAMPLLIRRMPMEAAQAKAAQMLQQVGLSSRMRHRPSQLSGGERQRVAIARSMVCAPACILADEPTGNLDRTTAAGIFERILELAKERATAFVLVTHDERLADRCDRVMALSQVLASDVDR